VYRGEAETLGTAVGFRQRNSNVNKITLKVKRAHFHSIDRTN